MSNWIRLRKEDISLDESGDIIIPIGYPDEMFNDKNYFEIPLVELEQIIEELKRIVK